MMGNSTAAREGDYLGFVTRHAFIPPHVWEECMTSVCVGGYGECALTRRRPVIIKLVQNFSDFTFHLLYFC